MKQRGHPVGFTLIELMIVIAIIAVIAAIAIPSLINSQRGSNERNASASLKTVATAQHDFRSNDRDGNRIRDFWSLDIAGLYTVYPSGATSSSAVRLIDITLAAADIVNSPSSPTLGLSPGSTVITTYARPAPKAGYWYFALASDAGSGTAVAYALDTDASGRLWHNPSSFGLGTFPDSYSSGRHLYLVNEGSTMFKRSCIATVRAGTANPPGAYPLPSGFVNGAGDPPANWPSDVSLKSNYAKMD